MWEKAWDPGEIIKKPVEEITKVCEMYPCAVTTQHYGSKDSNWHLAKSLDLSLRQWRASKKTVKSEFWKIHFATLFRIGWERQKMEACFSFNFAISKFSWQSVSGKTMNVWFPVAFPVPQQDWGRPDCLAWGKPTPCSRHDNPGLARLLVLTMQC